MLCLYNSAGRFYIHINYSFFFFCSAFASACLCASRISLDFLSGILRESVRLQVKLNVSMQTTWTRHIQTHKASYIFVESYFRPHIRFSVCLARFHHLSFPLYGIIVLNIIIIIIGARHRHVCECSFFRFYSLPPVYKSHCLLLQINNFLFNSVNERHFSLYVFLFPLTLFL